MVEEFKQGKTRIIFLFKKNHSGRNVEDELEVEQDREQGDQLGGSGPWVR